jgi:hypothetical protein
MSAATMEYVPLGRTDVSRTPARLSGDFHAL